VNTLEGNKLLITQALDERTLLIKKINDKIEKAEFADLKRVNQERAMGSRLTPEEFQRYAEGAYQQIMDLIDRYQRIDVAIVASNAMTKIETSYGTFTVAAAISLRNRLRGENLKNLETDYEKRLQGRMDAVYKKATMAADSKNRELTETAQNMRLSILGRENKAKEDKPLEVVDAYVSENTMEIIDPLNLKEKIGMLKEKRDTLLMELETQLKISNATTFITI